MIESDPIKEKIVKIVNKLTDNNYEEIENDLLLRDLGLHSLLMYKLVTELENEFGITFSLQDLDINNFNTINKIKDKLHSYIG